MENEVISLLEHVLNLKGRSKTFNSETELIGVLPELDSLAIANVLTNLESHFHIHIDDDDVDRTVFLTVGTLTQFIEHRVKKST